MAPRGGPRHKAGGPNTSSYRGDKLIILRCARRPSKRCKLHIQFKCYVHAMCMLCAHFSPAISFSLQRRAPFSPVWAKQGKHGTRLPPPRPRHLAAIQGRTRAAGGLPALGPDALGHCYALGMLRTRGSFKGRGPRARACAFWGGALVPRRGPVQLPRPGDPGLPA